MIQDPSRQTNDSLNLDKTEFFQAVESGDDQTDADATGEELWSDDDLDDDLEHEGDPADWVEHPHHDEDVEHARDNSGLALLVSSSVVALAALALTVLTAVAPQATQTVVDAMAGVGIAPAHLVVLGVVGILFASQRRQFGRLANGQHLLDQQFHARLGHFASTTVGARNDGDLQGTDQILVALHRQDEKINNLTRATKMFGKPMVEISAQISDVAGTVVNLTGLADEFKSFESQFSGTVDKLQSSLLSAIELHGEAAVAEQLAEVTSMTRRSTEGLKKLASVLESSTTETRKQFGDAVESLSKSASAQAPSQDLGPIESTLSTLQSQMQSLATSISQLQAAPVGTPQAPGAAPAAAGSEAVGVAENIAGPRPGGGKTVLGAIAKLKSMRT